MAADSVVSITEQYETWMRLHLPYVEKSDLEYKHDQLAGNDDAAAFRFLRGTFYLWAHRVREKLPELVGLSVPTVLGVGDLHLENFGTWRDLEGRLVWGVNDIDEATLMPYTQDLIRLATSAELAALTIGNRPAASLILGGYRSQMAAGGRAFVLAEGGTAVWKLAHDRVGNPERWWRKLDGAVGPEPDHDWSSAAGPITADFPDSDITALRWGTRRAGIGSLGRPRITAIGVWYGSKVAREAKSVLPSAWDWAVRHDVSSAAGSLFDNPHRAPDPYARVGANWSIRRLAPDSDKIPMDDLTSADNQQHLLQDMGRELANVHLATADAAAVTAHLPDSDQWLIDATKTMAHSVRHDQRVYREHR